ncbi:MAG: ATP-dependent protease, partial [Alphaproteobacteria bacterium]|nr:ATP-dependent protease [Alphaproteobacteria bacterium]
MAGTPLKPEALRRRTDPGAFTFKTTAELQPSDEALGQERALEAIRFGVGMRQDGYNMFALGPTGIGKHRMVRHVLERQAADRPAPRDWCYVHNFVDPHKPRALALPTGRARPFRAEMDRLIEEIKAALPAAFESDDYRAQRQAVDERMKERHEATFGAFQKKAQSRNVALIRTPTGLALAPMAGNDVMSPEDFAKLDEKLQEAIRAEIETLQDELQAIMQKMPQLEREHRNAVRELNRRVAGFAVTHLMEEVKKHYADVPAVVEHLGAVEADMVENIETLLRPDGAPSEARPGPMAGPRETMEGAGNHYTCYKVNVIVDCTGAGGAPVVYEDHPSHPNLFGKIEHRALFGALVTDFTMILPGALHRANGGYLIVDARKIFMQPFGWEELKRALSSREIRIEPLGLAFGMVGTASLEPQPIPLDVKVVLLGERELYYMLSAYDPEFGELFRVPVDFEDRIKREGAATMGFARFLAGLIRHDALKPFDAGAVARVMDRAARMAGDSERLSTQLDQVGGLLREADYWADQRNAAVVEARDVEEAIKSRVRRSDRMSRRMQEEVERGTILIDTAGEKVGQVNGLAVLSLGDVAFGKPSRITASVALGKGEIVDIEREVAMGGPLHTKGVLILSGFLRQRFGMHRPLSLKASLVFEQSYGGVDGDSASSTELYALLSALSGVPIRQGLAVTGSVNQFGQVQAIGGVNEKVEGF